MVHNPYHPLTPPDNPTLFFGRHDAIAFLRQHLVGGHNQHMLLLIGRGGMGKTSLLLHVPYIIDERYQPVYVSLQDLNSIPRLLSHMVDQILLRMEVIGASTYRVPPTPSEDESAEVWQRWFADEFLEVVLTAIRRDRFLALLLDDIHLLLDRIEAGQLPAALMDYLGELLARYDRLDILAALDIDHEEKSFRYPVMASPLARWRLTHLDAPAARQLITEPLQGQVEFVPDTVERVLILCGGHPFLLHSVCRLLHRHQQRNALGILGPAEIDIIYPAALEETGEILREFWGNITPNTRFVLQTLLHLLDTHPAIPFDLLKERVAGVNINGTRLAAKLRMLEYYDIIGSDENGAYHFKTQLEAEWIRQQHASTPSAQPRRMTRGRLVGLVAVVLVIAVILGMLAFGLFENGEEATPSDDLPPTATLEIEVE